MAADQNADKAQSLTKELGVKTENVLSTVGDRISHLGSTIKDATSEDGTIGSTVNSVASGIKNTGEYLRQNNLHKIKEDVGGMIKKHPTESLFVGMGLGLFLGAIFLRR